MNALTKAIELVGGQAELARKLGTSPQAVNNWLRRGNVPLEWVPEIVDITNGFVKADELRSDIAWHKVNRRRVKAA